VSRLSLSAGAGVATAAGHEVGRAASVELRGEVVRGLRAGVGYTRDYVGRDLVTVRATAGRVVGPVALTGEGALDLHVRADAHTRERVDLTLSAAAAVRVTRTLDLALEATGSDLEGFADAAEAEGGARVAAGPTLVAHLPNQVYLRASAAALWYATRSTPVAGVAPSATHGLLVDLAAGLRF
jgi:hypothetical protein